MSKLHFIFMACLLVFGCRKSDRANDTDTSLSEDVGNAHCGLFEVFLAVHESNLSTPGIRAYSSGATITADTLGSPRTVIIDFGTSGISSTSGRVRKGKIIVYQNGYYTTTSSTSEVWFDSFYINNYNYSGTFKITTTSSGYKLATSNLKISSPDSSFFYAFSGTYTLTQLNGNLTALADDDEFELSGTCNFTGSKGNTGAISIEATSPLLFNGTCAEPVGGTAKLQPSGLAPREISFGSGNCDRQFTVLINTEEITLNIGF